MRSIRRSVVHLPAGQDDRYHINDIFVRLPISTKGQLQMMFVTLSALTRLLNSNQEKSFVAVNRAFPALLQTLACRLCPVKYAVKLDNLWAARQSHKRSFSKQIMKQLT